MNILEGFQLADRLHAGQKDKLGHPYISHLVRVYLRVASRGGDLNQQLAALLHDSIEDRKATRGSLLGEGVPEEAVVLVEALTKPEGMPYLDYVRGVARVPRAIIVKEADLDDNSDPARLAQLADADAERLRKKYAGAKAALHGVE